MKLETAATIGGLIKDEQGKPIAGATVVINGLARDPVGQVVLLECDSVTTDAAGKWASHRVPAHFEGLNFKLAHPEFMPAEYDQASAQNPAGNVLTRESLLAGTAALQMERGIEVRGTVRELDGAKPVAEAAVLLLLTEEERRTTQRTATDSAGNFRFVLTQPGEASLMVEAPGLAPSHVAAEVERGAKPLVLVLDKGRPIEGRVLDGEGNPLAGVSVSVPSFQNLAPLKWHTQSDAQGRFTWETAPDSPVVLAFSKTGFVEEVQVLAGAATELTVRLDKPFSLSGKVLEAQTGEPIRSFKLTRGYSYGPNEESVNWDLNQTIPGVNGRYSVVSGDRRGGAIKYMVSADGFLPASSPAYGEKGAHTFDFALKRGQGLSGVVQLPGGEPVSGATVVLAENRHGAYMDKEGEFRSLGPSQSQLVQTDEQGRFKFESPPRGAHRPGRP